MKKQYTPNTNACILANDFDINIENGAILLYRCALYEDTSLTDIMEHFLDRQCTPSLLHTHSGGDSIKCIALTRPWYSNLAISTEIPHVYLTIDELRMSRDGKYGMTLTMTAHSYENEDYDKQHVLNWFQQHVKPIAESCVILRANFKWGSISIETPDKYSTQQVVFRWKRDWDKEEFQQWTTFIKERNTK